MHDAVLDDQLRSLLAPERAAIPDAGFSNAVLAAVPWPKAHPWRREALVLGMTFVGCLLGLIVLPGGAVLHDLLDQVPHSQFVRPLPIPWLVLVYTLCATSVGIAIERRDGYQRRDRRWSGEGTARAGRRSGNSKAIHFS